MVLSKKDKITIPDLEYQIRENIDDSNSDRKIQSAEIPSPSVNYEIEYAEDKAKEVRATVILRSLETCKQEAILCRSDIDAENLEFLSH